jgi:hypothetical protein
MGNALPKDKQLPLQIMNTNSAEFAEKVAKHRARNSEFFHYKGLGKVDICYQQVPVRLVPATTTVTNSETK